MKPGTIIRLSDGREGTVVYHGLDGYGIQFGRVEVDAERLLSGNAQESATGDNAKWRPEAMLRDSISPTADARMWPGMECVGEEYEIVPTNEMGASGAEGDQASPSLSPSEPSGRGESGGHTPDDRSLSMNKEEKK